VFHSVACVPSVKVKIPIGTLFPIASSLDASAGFDALIACAFTMAQAIAAIEALLEER
jgi:hypothetical protein